MYTVEKIHKFMFISIRSLSLIRINVAKLQRVQNIGLYASFRHVWTRILRFVADVHCILNEMEKLLIF